MCSNFEDRRSRDREWRQKNIKKTAILAWKFINLPITKKLLYVQSWS